MALDFTVEGRDRKIHDRTIVRKLQVDLSITQTGPLLTSFYATKVFGEIFVERK